MSTAVLPDTDDLLLERDGGVLTIWLNRPRQRNALSSRMGDELGRVLDAVRDDRTLRAIVLRGKGGTFCAGGDVRDFRAAMQARLRHDEVAAVNRRFGEVLRKMNEQPQVTIVLVEGAAIGGGVGLACCGDVTIATRDAHFRLSETSLGIVPAQIAPFVVERIGLSAARRLMLTAATVDAAWAQSLGLVHELAEDADALAAQCATVLARVRECAPGANAATKALLFATTRHPAGTALDIAAADFARCLLGPEGREGVAAFVARRRPRWADEEE